MAAPMPTLSSMLGNNSIAANGGSMADEVSESDNVPISIVESLETIRDKWDRFRILQEDFETVCKMTLVDDEAYLYSLYMKSPAFPSREFLCNYLSNLYRLKYPELFKKYPGLVPWLTFCLSMCRRHNEGHLKSLCANETVKSIQFSRASTFNLVMKRRAPATVPADEPEAKVAKVKVLNPLFANPIYVSHKILFNIGNCANYCIPSDFGILFMRVTTGKVNKFITANNKVLMEGLRVSFSRMIVGSLQSREIPFTCYSIAFVDDILETISKMTNLPISFNQLASGIRKNMERVEIFEGDGNTKVQGNVQLDANRHYFCLLSNFQCTTDGSKDSSPMLALRTYAATRYELNNNVFDPDEDALEQYERLIADKESELADKYEEYEALLPKQDL